VVMPDFLAVGGDGLMPVMKDVPKSAIQTDQSAPLRDLFIRELRKRGAAGETLSPVKDGRITVLHAAGPNEH
jgi:hypothetical protein